MRVFFTSLIRRSAPCLFLFAAAIAPACGGESTPPDDVDGPPVTVPDIAPDPVEAAFTVAIDPASPALQAATLEPKSGAATVTGGTKELSLTAFVKPVVKRPGILWVELYFENAADTALRDVVVTLKDLGGAAQVYDVTADVFAEATAPGEITLGTIAARGVGRIAIGVADTAPSKLEVTLTSKRTARRSTSSAPVAVTPDGKEAWAVVPDGDTVAVIDTTTDERIGQVPVPGHPASVGVTPDGAFVLVAASSGNTVSVIDRAAKKVVQVLGEADGIGREPRHLVISPDGGHTFVSAYVGDTITSIVRTKGGFHVDKSVPVKRRPTGMSVSPDGGTLYVAHFLAFGTLLDNKGSLSVLSTDPLEQVNEVVMNDTLNLDRAHCLADVFGVSAKRVVTEGAPTQMAGVFLNPAGTTGWVPFTRIAAGPITEKGANAKPLSPALDPKAGEFSPPFVLLADTRVPREPEEQLSIGNVERPVADSYVKCERFPAEIEMTGRDIIPGQPDQQVNRFPAFPAAHMGLTETGILRFVGFTRGGRRALLLAHSSDEIAVFDAITGHPSTQRHFQLSGNNPTGLAVTPDGAKAYVVFENSMFASVVDLSAYAKDAALPGPSYVPYEYRDVPEIPPVGGVVGSQQLVRHIGGVPDLPEMKEIKQVTLLSVDPLDPEMRRGRTLFASSNPDKYPTMTKSRLGTCGACHPDGASDGTLWSTMEGERRTMSLRGGVAGRGWLHAMGTHKDASEFASIIVKERLGGDPSPADTAALARWIAFGIPKLQHPVVDEALAAKGKVVFEQTCTGCHEGAQMTSGNPDPESDLGGGLETGPALYDVGTLSEDSHVLVGPFFESLFPPLEAQLFHELRGDRDLGEGDFVQQTFDFRARPSRKAAEYKAPSLVNVWDSALFFHDGRYDDLGDAVGHLDETLMLGLTADDKAAVLEYLRTL